MNLTDGKVMCGRRYFDGSGGNNHALLHFQETGYPLAVKLGTITPDGAGKEDIAQLKKYVKCLGRIVDMKTWVFSMSIVR